MINRNYIVCVEGDVSGYFGKGYFPRKFHYKKDAISAAITAYRYGAKSVTIKHHSKEFPILKQVGKS